MLDSERGNAADSGPPESPPLDEMERIRAPIPDANAEVQAGADAGVEVEAGASAATDTGSGVESHAPSDAPFEEPLTTGTVFVMILFLMALGGMWALMYLVLIGR